MIITKSVKSELKGLKEDNNEKINFRVWDVNCPGIAFASITLPSSLPLHLQSNFPSSSTATDKTKSQTTSSPLITTTTTSDDHSLSFDISLLPNNDNNNNDDHSSSSSSSESKEGSTTVQFTVTDFIRYIYTVSYPLFYYEGSDSDSDSNNNGHDDDDDNNNRI